MRPVCEASYWIEYSLPQKIFNLEAAISSGTKFHLFAIIFIKNCFRRANLYCFHRSLKKMCFLSLSYV